MQRVFRYFSEVSKRFKEATSRFCTLNFLWTHYILLIGKFLSIVSISVSKSISFWTRKLVVACQNWTCWHQNDEYESARHDDQWIEWNNVTRQKIHAKKSKNEVFLLHCGISSPWSQFFEKAEMDFFLIEFRPKNVKT